MNPNKGLILSLICLLLLLLLAAAVLAQTSPNFDLTWHLLGSSGRSSSANFQLTGTAGQSSAGPPAAGSSSYHITAGFWVFDTARSIYLPAVLRP